MMKTTAFPIAILASMALTGCGSDNRVVIPGDTSAVTAPVSFSMPRSLLRSDDEGLEGEASTAADVTREGAADVADIVGDQDVNDDPIQFLYTEVDVLNERLEYVQHQLKEMDLVWDQIQSQCSAIPAGENCVIPANSLTVGADDEKLWDVGLFLTGREITYVNTPDATYEHVVTYGEVTVDDTDTFTEEYRWDEGRSRILSKLTGKWAEDDADGTFSSNFVYVETSSGNEITYVENTTDGDLKWDVSMQMQELGGAKKNLTAKSESRWEFSDDEKGSIISSVVANDDGGQIGSTSDYTLADGSNVRVHSRHTFDANGNTKSAQYCEETEGVDCSKDENWEQANEDELNISQEGATSKFDLSEAEALVDSLDDFQMENIEMDFQLACAELELDESECLFDDILIIEDAEYPFENIQDSFEKFCEDESIDFDDCVLHY